MGREAALGELARRYLAGHAPAAGRDLARWAGTGLRDARPGLARCGAVQRTGGLAGLTVHAQRAAAGLPPPRLPGAFGPLLPGGRAAATWTIAGGQITLAPFAEPGPQTRAAPDTDAADVTRFLSR